MRVAVIDTETGGLNPNTHALLEVAAVIYDTETKEEIAVYTSMVRPCWHREVHPRALEVNKITEDELKNSPPANVVVGELVNLLNTHGVTIACGHNVAFDLGFINSIASEHNITVPLSHRTIDTQGLSGLDLLLGRVPSTSLDAMCAHYGIERGVTHRALADVRDTIKLLDALLARYGGVE